MILEIDKLCFSYQGQPTLHDIRMSIDEGAFIVLAGPSGCGKSTLLRLIAGFEPVDSGSITMDGVELSNEELTLPANKRNIGIVFQKPSLFPHLSVKDNIAFGIMHYNKKEREQRISQLLSQIGLEDHAEKYPHMLSGGQHQRVALARAVAPSPKVLLLDEPFANLDDHLRRSLRDEMRMFLAKEAITTIMVTHSPEEAMTLADHIYLLRHDGIIHQSGNALELYHSPNDIDVASFFSHINHIKGVVKGGVITTELGAIAYSDSPPADTTCDVGLRPEAIELLECSGADCEATIETISYSAGSRDITVKTFSGTLLKVSYRGSKALHSGDRVGLGLTGMGCVVF